MEKYTKHFNCTYSQQRKRRFAGTNQETTAQEPAAWTPITTNKVQSIIESEKKSRKGAGPDKLYNEYLKDTAYLLVPTWTKLYNKCIETVTIPEQWIQSK